MQYWGQASLVFVGWVMRSFVYMEIEWDYSTLRAFVLSQTYGTNYEPSKYWACQSPLFADWPAKIWSKEM